jgi:hypothetical protein
LVYVGGPGGAEGVPLQTGGPVAVPGRQGRVLDSDKDLFAESICATLTRAPITSDALSKAGLPDVSVPVALGAVSSVVGASCGEKYEGGVTEITDLRLILGRKDTDELYGYLTYYVNELSSGEADRIVAADMALDKRQGTWVAFDDRLVLVTYKGSKTAPVGPPVRLSELPVKQ